MPYEHSAGTLTRVQAILLPASCRMLEAMCTSEYIVSSRARAVDVEAGKASSISSTLGRGYQMPKLCRCGAIVDKRCTRCHPPTPHRQTTSERGYDHRWRQLSERKRAEDPLCEHCLQHDRVTPAEHVHHIVPIHQDPTLRLVWGNLMSVCQACHTLLERQ